MAAKKKRKKKVDPKNPLDLRYPFIYVGTLEEVKERTRNPKKIKLPKGNHSLNPNFKSQ